MTHLFWEQKDIMCLWHCQMCMIYSSACLVPFVLAGFLSSTHLSRGRSWLLAKWRARVSPGRGCCVESCQGHKTLERSHCEVMSLRPTKKKEKEKQRRKHVAHEFSGDRKCTVKKNNSKQWICLRPHNIWNVLFFFCSLGVFSSWYHVTIPLFRITSVPLLPKQRLIFGILLQIGSYSDSLWCVKTNMQ